MNSLRDIFVPDEWRRAVSALFLAKEASSEEHWRHFKTILRTLLPFACGASISHLIHPSISGDLRRALLTVVALLAGFTVTLMFFTGKEGKTEELELEEFQQYRRHILFLLWSQFKTLLVFVLIAVSTLAWEISVGKELRLDAIIVDAYFGLVGVGLLRSLVIPLQIIELHDFNLQTMLHAREKAIRRQLETERKLRVIEGQG